MNLVRIYVFYLLFTDDCGAEFKF